MVEAGLRLAEVGIHHAVVEVEDLVGEDLVGEEEYKSSRESILSVSQTNLTMHRNRDGSAPAIKQSVLTIENKYHETASKPAGLDLSSLSIQDKPKYPPRPGFGTNGQKVTLFSNHFELETRPNLILYLYDVTVKPDLVGRKMGQLFNLLLEQPHFRPHTNSIASDKRKFLVSCTKLDNVRVQIPHMMEDESTPSAKSTTHQVTVELKGAFTLSQLIGYLSSTTLGAPSFDKGSFLQALNIFLSNFAQKKPGIQPVGSSKCFDLKAINDNQQSWDLGAGLRAVRGYFNSIRVATGRILVNVNVSHIAIYNAGPLPELMNAYGTFDKGKLDGFLWGVRVKLLHIKGKEKKGVYYPRIKTVIGLATPKDGLDKKGKPTEEHPPRVKKLGAGAKDVEFWLNTENKYISVFDYFKKTYGRVLKFPDLPVVNTGKKDLPSYLPPEACEVIPGQPAKAKLSPKQTQGMIKFAVRKPWQNANSITNEGMNTVGLLPNVNPDLNNFGVRVSPNLISVPGRVLGEPKIIYKGNKSMTSRFGSWNLANVQMNKGITLKDWVCIAFPRSNQDAQALPTLLKNFTKTLRDTGLKVDDCKQPKLLNTPTEEDLQQASNPVLDALKSVPGGSRKVALVVLPNKGVGLYRYIKNKAEKVAGVYTICVVFENIIKDSVQYYANVAMKFNLKLGGVNHLIDKPKMGLIGEGQTMVVGLDVTHPSPGSCPNAPSVASIVASVDKDLGQWPGRLSIQEKRKEMITNLDDLLKSRLQLWRTKGNNKKLPDNILIYRDGVSEGQYDTVLEEELRDVRKACEETYPAQDTKKGLPHITIVIVGKRHHVRFYPQREADADRSANPKNGTVVDRGVTEARNWHFYLQAHTCLQGTARPAHYFVIHDEIFSKRPLPKGFANAADVLEDLTHSMCYLFPRATKAVSICPPAYLADLLCERGRVYLQRLFDPPNPRDPQSDPTPADVAIHPDLEHSMFYQ